MRLNKILKNALLVILACFALTACATKKKFQQVKCKEMFTQELTQLNI